MRAPATFPSFHVHLDVWLLFGSILAAYVIACRRHDRVTGEATPPRRKRFFATGIAVLFVGASWPIHDLAERYLYSVHMAQHILFTLVAPPLLIAGMPAWLLREFLRPRPVVAVFRVVTKPLVALILFNGVLLFTHWPAVVTVSVQSEWIHFGLHLLLVSSALAMWWPVMSPLPEFPALPAPGQMLYLFLQSLAPTIPASFLTFGDHPLYHVYTTFPRLWGIGALNDQLTAGLIMKIIGGAILWGFIATIFFRWYEREHDADWDASRYRDVEHDIRAELTR
jgi:putative membrane protein